MIKLEYRTFSGFKRFLKLLVGYIRLNVRLILVYLAALTLDSFAKMFSVVAIIPLIDFLSGGEAVDFQKVTLVFIDLLSIINIEYTLVSCVLVFILAVLTALIAEIFFYFIGRKNAYRISYYLSSMGMRSYFNRGLKFINAQTFGVIQNTFQREVEKISGGVDGILLMVSSIIQIFFYRFFTNRTIIIVFFSCHYYFSLMFSNLFLQLFSSSYKIDRNYKADWVIQTNY